MSRLPTCNGPFIAIALLLGAAIIVPGAQPAWAAPPIVASTATPADVDHIQRAHERSEARIAAMHKRLHLTAAQEPLWTNVAQMMRDNATSFHANIHDRAKDATAVEKLKVFESIAEEHAAGLKKLIPVFEKLYADLTPEQKKNADQLFEHSGRRGERN